MAAKGEGADIHISGYQELNFSRQKMVAEQRI
jgi:hypothetical protein